MKIKHKSVHKYIFLKSISPLGIYCYLIDNFSFNEQNQYHLFNLALDLLKTKTTYSPNIGSHNLFLTLIIKHLKYSCSEV